MFWILKFSCSQYPDTCKNVTYPASITYSHCIIAASTSDVGIFLLLTISIDISPKYVSANILDIGIFLRSNIGIGIDPKHLISVGPYITLIKCIYFLKSCISALL